MYVNCDVTELGLASFEQKGKVNFVNCPYKRIAVLTPSVGFVLRTTESNSAANGEGKRDMEKSQEGISSVWESNGYERRRQIIFRPALLHFHF